MSACPGFDPRFVVVAERHGVDISATVPRSRAESLTRLKSILQDQSSKYQIPGQQAAEYFRAAEANVSLRVGSLTEATVDLGDFAAEQHYDKYTCRKST